MQRQERDTKSAVRHVRQHGRAAPAIVGLMNRVLQHSGDPSGSNNSIVTNLGGQCCHFGIDPCELRTRVMVVHGGER